MWSQDGISTRAVIMSKNLRYCVVVKKVYIINRVIFLNVDRACFLVVLGTKN